MCIKLQVPYKTTNIMNNKTKVTNICSTCVTVLATVDVP